VCISSLIQSSYRENSLALFNANALYMLTHDWPICYPSVLFSSDTLTSFGWSDYHYKYTPDPTLTLGSSSLRHLSESELWDDLWREEILWGTNNLGRREIDRLLGHRFAGTLFNERRSGRLKIAIFFRRS